MLSKYQVKKKKMAHPTPVDVALLHHYTPLRILFVTLEFKAGAFSGNGVYAQSQVRALAAAGHDVHVVSGQPLSLIHI